MSFHIQADKLAALIRLTRFATTTDNSRYAVDAVQVEVDAQTVRMIATDGHRLAVAEVAEDTGLEQQGFVEATETGLIPTDALPKLDKVKGDVLIDLAGRWIEVEGKRTKWAKVKGKFPNYQTVLPDWDTVRGRRTFAVDRDALIHHLKLARIMADTRSRTISLSLNGDLTVEAVDFDAGEYQGQISLARPGTGEPLRVGFNADYLLDYLKAAARGPIHVQLQDEERGAEFQALAEEDCKSRYLVMPTRV
jgi:DNA polymerase-3 subunit beta